METALKKVLKMKNVSIYYVAQASGINISCLYRLTTGERDIHNVKFQTLQKLANVLTEGNVVELLSLIDRNDNLLKLVNEEDKIKE